MLPCALLPPLPASWLTRAFLTALAFATAPTAGAFDFSPEAGRPVFRNFRPNEYRGHPQVYNVVLHHNGLVYFSSEQGILEFDGTRWRHLPAACPMVHRMAADEAGRLWIAGLDELGYYDISANGAWHYQSVRPDLPDAYQLFGRSRGLVSHRQAVFLSSQRGILRWRDGEFHVWPSLGVGEALFSLHGELYAALPTGAPRRLAGDAFVPLPPPPVTLSDSTTVTALPLPDGRVLWCWDHAGLFAYDPRTATWAEFASPARELIRGSRVTSSLALPDGTLVIGTTSRGVLLLSADGRHVRRFDRSHGLIDNVVLSLMHDRDGGLWLGFNTGAARVEIDSPLTVFDAANGLAPGTIDIWGRHDGRLYAGAYDGLYQLEPADDRTGQSARFTRISDRLRSVFGLESADGSLIVFSHTGVHRLLPDRTLEPLLHFPTNGTYAVVRSKLVPDRFYVGGQLGLGVVEKRPDGWKLVHERLDLGDAHTAIEDRNGDVWLGTYGRGFWRLPAAHTIRDWSQADATFEHYHKSHGLPEAYAWTNVYNTPDGPGFFTSRGNRRFDPVAKRFVPDQRFKIDGRPPVAMYPEITTATGDTWATIYGESTMAAKFPLGRFVARGGHDPLWVGAPAGVIREIGFAGVAVAHLESVGAAEVLWARGYDNMIRLDLSRRSPPPSRWTAIVRAIAAEGRAQDAGPDDHGPLAFRFSRDPLVFTLAAPRYGALDDLRFQTRLLGFSDKWSEPSAIAQSSFTNLEGGPFTLEARAIDLEGNVSDPARVTFRIAPPLHRSPAAFLVYALAGLASVLGVVRWRVRKIDRERQRLEHVVAERTAELKTAKDLADEASRAKSAFLANMSHELRTPLNGVIGYAQVLQKSPDVSDRDRERLRVVQSSGEHLLRMINEVLDFSKIEAGKLELRPAPFHLPQLLRDVASALEPRAAQKQLRFTLTTSPDLPAMVLGDAQKLRQVLDNLLSNAVKFTPAGSVELRVSPQPSKGLDPLTLHVVVEDTGIGIAPDDQLRLFQPFHQPADGRPPEPGTGLGLAIAKRLVELMGGQLSVESAPGEGSVFSFTLLVEPLASSPHSTEQVTRAAVGYHGTRRRLLIVDDVAVNRAVLVELLAPLGFELREAASGDAALAVLPEFKPDLIFLDLRMPGMDGLELARRLRLVSAKGPRLVLIAMSASVLSFNRDHALEAGCDDFLPKPFREADLLGILHRTLKLEWTFASGTEPEPSPPPCEGASSELLEALLLAAQRGEIATLRRLLASLRANDPALASEIDALLRVYQLEPIRERLSRRLAAGA